MEYQHILTRPANRVSGSAALISDQPVALGIKYIGTLASATITVVAATAITLKHGTAGAETADTTVGASANGAVDFATDTTLGAVVDRINASPNWRAEIIDGLRADVVSASQIKALSVYTLSPLRQVKTLVWDTSVHLSFSWRISARRDNWFATQIGKRSLFMRCLSLVNITSGALSFLVYDVDRASGTTRLLGSWVPTDNVAFDTGAQTDPLFISDVGHDLLCRETGSGDLPDATAYFNIVGFVEK